MLINTPHGMSFKVMPTVYEDDDHRKKYNMDYMILKMFNKRTFIVVELNKSCPSSSLCGLFSEASKHTVARVW